MVTKYCYWPYNRFVTKNTIKRPGVLLSPLPSEKFIRSLFASPVMVKPVTCFSFTMIGSSIKNLFTASWTLLLWKAASYYAELELLTMINLNALSRITCENEHGRVCPQRYLQLIPVGLRWYLAAWYRCDTSREIFTKLVTNQTWRRLRSMVPP